MPLTALLVFAVSAQAGPSLNDRLVLAVRHNDLARTRALIAKGAQVNYKGSRTPVLLEAFHAQTKGSVEPMVNLLLDKGAKPNAIDGFGWCALTIVPPNVSAKLVKKLLDKGADPNRIAMHGDPALYRFTGFERLDLIKLLIGRGAKVDGESYFGATSFGEAASMGRLDIMRYLRSKGANPKYMGWSKQTALHFAVRAAKNNVQVLDYLLSFGLDVNARSEMGLTPLHSVAVMGNADNAKWLLAHGADRTLKDEKGETALDTALRSSVGSRDDRSEVIAVLRG